jgi:hypothetical protein
MTELIVVNLMESLDVFIMISVQCGILAERSTLCSVQVQQDTTTSWWRLQLQDDEGRNYNYMMTRWEEEADSNWKKVLKFVYIFLQCIRCLVQALTDPADRRIFKHCWKSAKMSIGPLSRRVSVRNFLCGIPRSAGVSGNFRPVGDYSSICLTLAIMSIGPQTRRRSEFCGNRQNSVKTAFQNSAQHQFCEKYGSTEEKILAEFRTDGIPSTS